MGLIDIGLPQSKNRIMLSWTFLAFECELFFGLCAPQSEAKGLDFDELRVRLTFSPQD